MNNIYIYIYILYKQLSNTIHKLANSMFSHLMVWWGNRFLPTMSKLEGEIKYMICHCVRLLYLVMFDLHCVCVCVPMCTHVLACVHAHAHTLKLESILYTYFFIVTERL